MSRVQGGRSPWWVGPPLRLTKPGAIPGWAFLAPKLGRIPPTGQEPGCSLRPPPGHVVLSLCFVASTRGETEAAQLAPSHTAGGAGAAVHETINWDKLKLGGGVQMGRRWDWVPPPWLVSRSASARQGRSRAGLLGSGSYLAVHRGLSESGGGRTRAWPGSCHGGRGHRP